MEWQGNSLGGDEGGNRTISRSPGGDKIIGDGAVVVYSFGGCRGVPYP